jgi:hypothetical protein
MAYVKAFLKAFGFLLLAGIGFTAFVAVVMVPSYVLSGPVSFWEGIGVILWVVFCFSFVLAVGYAYMAQNDYL